MKTRVMLALSLLVLGQLALAAGQVSVKVDMRQQKTVVDANGKSHVELVPVGKIVPGTVVTYVISYANEGKEAADDVVLHDPIPEHMLYVEGSAKGDNAVIAYSVDDGKHWGDKVGNLKVKESDGKLRSATATDVTTLRWTVRGKVVSGAKGEVQFAAQLK